MSSCTAKMSSRLAPMVAMSTFLPLNENDEVRAITRRPLIFASTFSNSSARPSDKYSSLASPVRLANGNTAIESAGVLLTA